MFVVNFLGSAPLLLPLAHEYMEFRDCSWISHTSYVSQTDLTLESERLFESIVAVSP